MICPGVNGENLAMRALEAFRFATDWEITGLRLTIDKRVPIAAGMAGGSSDAAAALRLASTASGFPIPPGLPMRLGADVTVMLEAERALMTGAGEHVEKLPGAKPRLIVVPLDAALTAGEVYRAFDAHCTPRTPDELEAAAAQIRAGGAFAHVNDLEAPARRAVPGDRPGAGGAARARGRARDGQRLRTDRLRHQRRPGRGRPAACRGLSPRRRRMKYTWLAAAVALAGWLIARRDKQKRWFQIVELVVIVVAVLIGFGVIHLPNFEQLLEDAGKALGPWTYLAVGVLAFLETGAFLGFIAPGETAVIVGGLVAGQGEISLLALIAIVWACCLLGDTVSYELGQPQGPRVAAPARQRGCRSPRTGSTRSRGSSTSRGAVMIIVGRFLGFVRPLMPVHRRRLADAVPALLPLRRARRGRVVDHVLHARVPLLALDRQAHDLRLARAVRARHAVVVIAGDRRADPPAPQPGGAREGPRLDRRARRPARAGSVLARISRPVWHFALRPAAAVADMTARFSYERLTPGNLGLELTTLLALAARRDVLVLPARRHRAQRGRAADRPLGARTSPTALNNGHARQRRQGRDPARLEPRHRGARLATAIFAAVRRRPIEAVSLVAGWLIVFALVHITKIALRPRAPARRLRRDDQRGVSRRATPPTPWRGSRAPRCSSAPASAGPRASPP